MSQETVAKRAMTCDWCNNEIRLCNKCGHEFEDDEPVICDVVGHYCCNDNCDPDSNSTGAV